MIGEKVSVEQVMREVEKDRSFYRKSGGGMTLSGGEPLMQGEFALELIRAAKKVGLIRRLKRRDMQNGKRRRKFLARWIISFMI